MTRQELIEAVRRLAKQGYSQGEIGQHLGKTRCTIAGIGYSNGITFANNPKRKRKAGLPGLPPYRGPIEPVKRRAKTGKRGFECDTYTVDKTKLDARELRRQSIIADIERLTGRPRPTNKVTLKPATHVVARAVRIPDAFAHRCVWAGCTLKTLRDKPYCEAHLLQSGGLIMAKGVDE